MQDIFEEQGLPGREFEGFYGLERGSADRGVKGVFDPPEHLLTSFHMILVGGIWRPPTFFTFVLTPLTP